MHLQFSCQDPSVISQQPADSEAVHTSAAIKQSRPKLMSDDFFITEAYTLRSDSVTVAGVPVVTVHQLLF